MNNLKNVRVFVEYVSSSVRPEPTAPKGWWDILSVPHVWRHARIVVTKEAVPFVGMNVEGLVYDAGKDDKNKLVPMYEKFTPTPGNWYLPIGDLKPGLGDSDIKGFGKYRLTLFLLRYPLSHHENLGVANKILYSAGSFDQKLELPLVTQQLRGLYHSRRQPYYRRVLADS